MLCTIFIKPGSKRESITLQASGDGVHDILVVAVRGRPINDQANKDLMRVLGVLFGVPRTSIRILRGHASRYKTVQISGDDEQFRQKIQKL